MHMIAALLLAVVPEDAYHAQMDKADPHHKDYCPYPYTIHYPLILKKPTEAPKAPTQDIVAVSTPTVKELPKPLPKPQPKKWFRRLFNR